MLQTILEFIIKYFPSVPSVFVLFAVLALGMYIFWYECKKTLKNDSSIFDIFIASTVIGGIIGRISYIISYPHEFDYIWYWLPYEKYGDQIFLFRLLPWRFFRIWDFQNDTFAMFTSLCILATLFVIFIKKWKWSHLYTAIYFCAYAMLGASIFLSGTNTNNLSWTEQGLIMLILLILSMIFRLSTQKISIKRKNRKISIGTDVLTIVLCTAYIVYSYVSTPMTSMEKVDLIVFSTWTIIGLLMYISESNKGNVTIESISSVQRVTVKDLPKNTKLWKKE